jgi:hypothetical protein
MTDFTCFSTIACRRENNAFAVGPNGTVSIAVFVPSMDADTINTSRSVHVDRMVHEEPRLWCTFDTNCRKRDCSFRHSHKEDKNVTQLLHTTELRKGKKMGFNADVPKYAVVITIDSNTLKFLGVEVKQIVVNYWYEEQHGGELPPGHREAAERINAAVPPSAKFTGNAEVLEEYSLDPAGKRVPKYREYNMRRFYVETCLDVFNSHAEQVCFEAGVTLLAQWHRDLDYLGVYRQATVDLTTRECVAVVLRREIRRARKKGMAVAMKWGRERIVSTFSHPLRDYESMHNIHALFYQLTGEGSNPHPPLTDENYIADRNWVLDYINELCYAGL